MTDKEKLLYTIKQFFRDSVVNNHIRNVKNLRLSDFNRNPFLETYLANFAFGDASPESVAKILVYPRILGTSITTTFGTQVQNLCHTVLSGYASTTSGMDIEYTSAIDGEMKYCQMKAGPKTINKDDVKTICDHFKNAKNLGRTNKKRIYDDDCVVGVIYGTHSDLSAHYRAIEQEGYTVLAGSEFWRDFTGDPKFYDDLIKCFAEVAVETQSGLFDKAVKRIADDLRKEHLQY